MVHHTRNRMAVDEPLTVVVDRPPREVSAFIADLGNAKQWAPQMGEVVDASGPMRGEFAYHFEPVGPGTRISQDVDIRLAGPRGLFSGAVTREAATKKRASSRD